MKNIISLKKLQNEILLLSVLSFLLLACSKEDTPASPVNNLPTANAGADQSITMPVNTVTLNGSGTDVDGTITSYQWLRIDGLELIP